MYLKGSVRHSASLSRRNEGCMAMVWMRATPIGVQGGPPVTASEYSASRTPRISAVGARRSMTYVIAVVLAVAAGCARSSSDNQISVTPPIRWTYVCYKVGPVTADDMPSSFLGRDDQGQWGWIPFEEMKRRNGCAIAVTAAGQLDQVKSGMFDNGQ